MHIILFLITQLLYINGYINQPLVSVNSQVKPVSEVIDFTGRVRAKCKTRKTKCGFLCCAVLWVNQRVNVFQLALNGVKFLN